MRTLLLATFFSLVSLACAKDPPAATTELTSGPAAATAKPTRVWPAATACDSKGFTTLSHDLDTANGIGLDRSKPGVEATIQDASRRVAGKIVALQGCSFAMQGNDLVWFAPADMKGRAAVDAGIACKMKDGVDGVTALRNAAMTKSPDEMKLDVRGVVAVQDDFLKHLGLTECEITVH